MAGDRKSGKKCKKGKQGVIDKIKLQCFIGLDTASVKHRRRNKLGTINGINSSKDGQWAIS